jgi:hypothetical protein
MIFQGENANTLQSGVLGCFVKLLGIRNHIVGDEQQTLQMNNTDRETEKGSQFVSLQITSLR